MQTDTEQLAAVCATKKKAGKKCAATQYTPA